MFISQVDIEEFRGIKKCQEPLRLSKFNVLLGRNNAGKSTVLGALSLLPLPWHAGPIGSLSRKDFLGELIGGPRSLVYAYSGKARVSYVINDSQWKIELEDTGAIGFSIDNVTSSDTVRQVASSLDVEPNAENIQRLVFFIPNSTEFIKTLIRNVREDRYWNFVVKQRAHLEAASQISECVDDKYTEILIYKDALCARKELPKGGPFYIKLEDLGDGVEKVAAVMLFVNTFTPDVILWDDFEASAHPSLMRMLLSWLNSRQWQVVLSTHSIDVLDRLLELKLKDAQIIQLKKTSDDILLHKELTMEELEDIMKANQDPRLLVDALQL